MPATISLLSSSKLKAWALDERGQRKSEVPLRSADGRKILEISPAQKTLCWELSVTGT